MGSERTGRTSCTRDPRGVEPSSTAALQASSSASAVPVEQRVIERDCGRDVARGRPSLADLGFHERLPTKLVSLPLTGASGNESQIEGFRHRHIGAS